MLTHPTKNNTQPRFLKRNNQLPILDKLQVRYLGQKIRNNEFQGDQAQSLLDRIVHHDEILEDGVDDLLRLFLVLPNELYQNAYKIRYGVDDEGFVGSAHFV